MWSFAAQATSFIAGKAGPCGFFSITTFSALHCVHCKHIQRIMWHNQGALRDRDDRSL